MAATVTKWRGVWCRFLLTNKTLKPRPIKPLSRNISSLVPNPNTPRFFPPSIHPRLFSSPAPDDDAGDYDDDGGDDDDDIKDPIQELLAELEREKQRARDQKAKAGTPSVDVDEDEEDYMGVQPLIDKLEKSKTKYIGPLELYEEPTDSESDDEDDERFTEDAINKDIDLFEKKHERHEELLGNFVDAETCQEAFKWMEAIDKFEQKHLRLPLEYRVIGEMLNRLKEASGKDRFMLLQKLNRAIRRVQWKEAYDPDNPANYGIIEHEEVGPSADTEDVAAGGNDEEKELLEGLEDDEEDFDEDKDNILLEKLNAIDKKLEEKLALLENTFGKKGRVLEEEIKDLADERTALTETSTQPRYRKGFDVRLIDVNRTCKVTKGGQVISFTAMVACGNYNGVVGFAKAKAPTVPVALQKAHEKCFQNLHFIERHEEHTIAHAVQTKYKKTKVYLWPASTRTGMKASKTVQIILNLAGFKNIKSKVIGSRNPHNTVKAVFKALNSIETPKDVQEKFGRTVVESYLL